MKTKGCRFTVEFPKQLNDIIEFLAKKEGLSKVVILKKAISLYHHAWAELTNGNSIAIIKGDKIIKELIIT